MLFFKIRYKKAFVANLSHVTLAMLYFGFADFGSAQSPQHTASICLVTSTPLSTTLRRIELSRNIKQVFGSGLKMDHQYNIFIFF
jgi:hypothetical protein